MRNDDTSGDPLKRRTVLRASGAVTGTALLSGVGSAEDSGPIESEELEGEERRSLIGAVMSAATYRSVRARLKDDDYNPAPGRGISEQVRHTGKDEQVDRLFFPCTTRGGTEGGRDTDLAAEVVSVQLPNGGIHVVGVIAEGAPMSEGGEWVKQYVSTPAALRQTESGVYTVGPITEEN
jgi:hypothetical protein